MKTIAFAIAFAALVISGRPGDNLFSCFALAAMLFYAFYEKPINLKVIVNTFKTVDEEEDNEKAADEGADND